MSGEGLCPPVVRACTTACRLYSAIACISVSLCVQCKEIEEKLNVYRRQVGRSLVNIPDSIAGE